MNIPPIKDMIPNRDEFLKFVAFGRDFAISELHDKRKSVIPHLMVLTKNPPELKEGLTVLALAVDFNEAEDKHKLLFGIGQKFFSEKQIPVAICLLSEAWLSAVPMKEGIRRQPRDDPNRREVIVIFAMTIDNKLRVMVSIPVKRDEKKNLIQDGPPDDFGGMTGNAAMPETNLLSWFCRGYLAKMEG